MDEMDLYWEREGSSRRERRGFIMTVWGGVIRLSAPFMSPSSSAGGCFAVLVCCAAPTVTTDVESLLSHGEPECIGLM